MRMNRNDAPHKAPSTSSVAMSDFFMTTGSLAWGK
jgi:hypothetical protein